MPCRICRNPALQLVLSLGTSPLANNFLKHEHLTLPEPRFPLDVYYCDRCNLVQLGHVVSPDLMFKHYVYVTSTTQTFRTHFAKFAEDVTREYGLGSSSLAVDIGSNDGLLLANFKRLGVQVIGVEPAENIVPIAEQNGVETINSYWNEGVVRQIISRKGHADVVTANNVFAHIDDIHDVTRNVKTLLKRDGIFVMEAAYMLDMFKDMTFDTVYHEHLCYYSLHPLVHFFKLHGMTVFDVKHVDSHGGSLRVFVKKDEGRYPVTDAVTTLLRDEAAAGVRDWAFYARFGDKVRKVREELITTVNTIRSAGKKVVAYGAPAKGNTLLNYCNFTTKDIKYIIEDNPLKVGLYAPGTHIPCVSSQTLKDDQPDYVLILAWNFKNEILAKTKWLADKGVKFIIPMPTPTLV